MKDCVRLLVRVAAVFGIVIFCGAAACSQHPVGDISYAPGYGYVVKVQQLATHYQRDHDYYFIFPTEERAREFYGEYYSNEKWPDTLRPGERQIYDGNEEFNTITKLLRPPPPPLNELELPLGNPQLPDPIPSIPQ